MGSSRTNTPDPEPEPTTVEDNALSGTQEAVPVPFFAGQQKFPLKWFTRVLNQYTTLAPKERPGGKK